MTADLLREIALKFLDEVELEAHELRKRIINLKLNDLEHVWAEELSDRIITADRELESLFKNISIARKLIPKLSDEEMRVFKIDLHYGLSDIEIF
jgi:hypothetical protein